MALREPQTIHQSSSFSETLFLHITKVLIYKTISSPFKASHILSQSEYINGDCSIYYYPQSETLHFLNKMLIRKFHGNLYDILRGLFMHKSCELFYHSKINVNDIFVGDLNKNKIISHIKRWILLSFISYPLHYIYINYMIDNNNEYNGIFSVTKISNMWSGFHLSLFQSIIHCIAYIGINEKINKYYYCNNDKSNDIIRKLMIKYTSMAITNLISYPLNTMKTRLIMTNGEYKWNIFMILDDDGVYNGILMYLLKSFISQICIDGCDMIINLYKKRKFIKIMNENSNNNKNIICPICYENDKQFQLIIPCGHCVCIDCKSQIQKCHICRSQITGYHKMYF